MKYTPATSTIDTLTVIWKQVLHLSSVGMDDNFFDLGGDSSLALELFNEIALACGCELPPVTIYHAPTIAALAELIEQPSTPRVPPIVRLKDGCEPPIFIAHGLGGSVIDFYQVVKYIETPRAIYGLQAKGIDGVEEPFDRIEDMARFSLDAVRELQPHGPYFMVGFSLGGLVMLEMAQQLVAQGEKVALLAMLDSYPHASRLSREQRAAPLDAANVATDRATRCASTAVARSEAPVRNDCRCCSVTNSSTFPRVFVSGLGTVSTETLPRQNTFCAGGHPYGLPSRSGGRLVSSG